MFIGHCLTLVIFCTFVSIDWLEKFPASSMWPKAMFDDVMLVLQISLEMHVTAWVGRKEEKGALCGRYQSRRRHINNRLNKASATQKTLTRVQTWRRLPRGVFTLVDHWQTCDTGRAQHLQAYHICAGSPRATGECQQPLGSCGHRTCSARRFPSAMPSAMPNEGLGGGF